MNQSIVVSQPACKYLYCERRNAFVLKTSLFKEAALKAVAVLALLAIALALRLIAISGTGTDTPDQRVRCGELSLSRSINSNLLSA